MRAAIFTISQDDRWLPEWAAHAVEQGFAPEDVYVLDHDNRGSFKQAMGSLARRRHSVVQVRNPLSYDYGWMSETVSAFQRFLIQQYDCVVFTASDELLYPLGVETVVDALATLKRNVVALPVQGWDVIERPGLDLPLDFARPWVEQRSMGVPSRRQLRIRVTFQATTWMPPMAGGQINPFCRAYNLGQPSQAVENLVVAHMHRADSWSAVNRHRSVASRRLQHYPAGVTSLHGHNLQTGIEAVSNWLVTDPDDPSKPAALRPLPMINQGVRHVDEGRSGSSVSIGQDGTGESDIPPADGVVSPADVRLRDVGDG